MARAMIETAIAENPVMVFSKSFCPFCIKAKQALMTLLDSSKFKVLEIESRPDCGKIQDELLELTGGRSVPRVFVGGKFIGGGSETAQLVASGEMKQLLIEAGAL